MQDPHILPRGPLRSLFEQGIVGHAEATAGEQVGLVAVIGKRPRLADQPVDDVPVVHPMFAATTQPRQHVHLLLAVPHLDPLGILPGLDPLADQAAGHRVDVAFDADEAARLHPHSQPLARLQPTRRQRTQAGQLLGQAILPTAVALAQQLPQEGRVGIAMGEVAAAPQQQALLQGLLELVMALLAVAVLVGLTGVDRLTLQAIVAEQRLVATLEHLGIGTWLHRCRQPVGAVNLRHAAQLPQGVLQALAEALQALAKADRHRLPVRVGQHEVVDQVREGMTRQGNAQVVAVAEIRGRQPTGVMDLGEEDLLGRSLLGTPLLEASLQGPHLAVWEAARILPLQGLEEGLGLQTGVERQLLLQLSPDLGKGVGACTPVVLHGNLARQLAQPPVLAGGLLIHACRRRSLALGATAVEAE